MSTKARRMVVTGRVQGVAYRAHTADQARRLGLAGFVRNLRDGRVELFAQGPEAAVADLEAWCRRGPALARVDAVEASDAGVDPRWADFEIAPTADA